MKHQVGVQIESCVYAKKGNDLGHNEFLEDLLNLL